MIELASVIFALLMEVLVDVILVQPLKATSREKTAWPVSHRFIIAKKLHRFTEPTHLAISALTERSRDTDAEAKDQKAATRAEGPRSEGQKGPESKSWGPRLRS